MIRQAIRAIACLLVLASAASAQQAAPWYAGKTIRIVVGSSTGGYYDAAGRTAARFLPDYIPGKPSIVVQNLPDSGGAMLGNRLATTFERDGTVLAAIGQSQPQLALLGDPSVQFDPLKLTWLGSLTSFKGDAYMMIVPDTNRFKSWTDAAAGRRAIYLGGTKAGSTNTTFALIARDVLHMNIELVRGFPGANEIWLAMERGEVDGQMISISAVGVARPKQWAEGKLRTLVNFGAGGRLTNWPEAPDALELVTNEEDRALVEFAELPFFMSSPFVAPPGVPADRAQILRDAFMAMARDPAFQAELRRVGLLASPIDGDAVLALIRKAAQAPESVRKRFAALQSEQ